MHYTEDKGTEWATEQKLVTDGVRQRRPAVEKQRPHVAAGQLGACGVVIPDQSQQKVLSGKKSKPGKKTG